MKKIYQAPTVNVVVMQMNHHLMDASANGTVIRGNASSSNAVLSRESDWDDED